MTRRTLAIAAALVVVVAGIVMWRSFDRDTPDVVWISADSGDIALDPDGGHPAAMTLGPFRWRRPGTDHKVLALIPTPRPPTTVDRLREIVGLDTTRQPSVYVRCDVRSRGGPQRWAAYVWSGWTGPEYIAASQDEGDAMTAARRRAIARVGEDRFRELGGTLAEDER